MRIAAVAPACMLSNFLRFMVLAFFLISMLLFLYLEHASSIYFTVKTCTELVIWVWLNAINKLKSYLYSGSVDMCVRSHVIALALSLGVPGKLCELLILPPSKLSCNALIAIQSRAPASSEIIDDP